MRDHDGASSNSSDDTGPDPGPPPGWSVRVTAAAGIVLAGLLSLVGSAAAAPAAPIGQWVSAGAQVNLDASASCLIGGCPTTWYSDREQAAVEVVCTDGATEVKVRGYFGQGEDVLTGRTSAENVKVVGWTPPACGPLD